jgi:hypothetical protein
LIFLNFRPLQSGSAVVVRGAHFRICADGTLRGPDNTIAARYLERLWHLGQKRYLSFECGGALYLRVTNRRGQRECIGPYATLRAADGAIFTQDSCLGVHAVRTELGSDTVDLWREIAFLTSI